MGCKWFNHLKKWQPELEEISALTKLDKQMDA
jgi:hypothetical protein